VADDEQSWLTAGASLTTEQIRQHYDDWADSYDDTLRRWGYRAPEEVAAMLAQHAPADAAILDAGCGTGWSGKALREQGFTGIIDGGELSEASVAIARGRAIYDRVDVMNVNALPLPIAADRYDATVCVGVLTYVADVGDVLREFARITRPGGQVLVTHRQDIAEANDFHGLTKTLAREGTLETVRLTEPGPYLPGNPDFGDAIGVYYALFRVC